MKEDFNILFSSAGRRVSLIRHFKQTLSELGLPGKVVAVDQRRNSPACFVSDSREVAPGVESPDYVEALKQFCRIHEIRLLVPLIDTELYLLSRHKTEFEAMGVTVLVSSPETNAICFDKRDTYRFFKRIGVATPELYAPQELLGNLATRYPLFLKPACGSSSIGAVRISNRPELEFYLQEVSDPIVQEFMDGQEYTVDVLIDFEGNVRSAVPRLRIETRSGEVSKGMTVRHPAIIETSKKVAEALPGAVGCITMQCFLRPSGDISFTEINPRFGGGIPLTIKAGADFPRWIIGWMLGTDLCAGFGNWRENLVMLRYDAEIFVEREETL